MATQSKELFFEEMVEAGQFVAKMVLAKSEGILEAFDAF